MTNSCAASWVVLPAMLAVLAGAGAWRVRADQLSSRPDPSGLMLRTSRLRTPHTVDLGDPGGSFRLQWSDPWFAYELGRAVFLREWRETDGLFRSLSARPIAGAATSCGMCHNLPFRAPGAGGTVGEPSSTGRNVPHLFGSGLVEMVAQQVSADILRAHDLNHNGFLDEPAETRGRRAIVAAGSGVLIDFGPLDDLNGDGYPGLNDAIQLLLVGPDGRLAPDVAGRPARPDDPGVAGYVPILAPFSAAVGDHHISTLRLFVVGAFQTILGFPVEDPTVTNDAGAGRDARAGDGWAETSNAGAPQPYFGGFAAQPRRCDGLSAGEVDLVEWYLLNHPPPGSIASRELVRRVPELLDQFGCTSCHVRQWVLAPRDAVRGTLGDRRFFDLRVNRDPQAGSLRGQLRSLTDQRTLADGTVAHEPRRAGFTIDGIYTDLRHHDLGDRFYEYGYVGERLTVTRRFRTAPLWGVGSSAPYGHDGYSPTLEHVIERHGGEAEASAHRFRTASDAERAALLDYLRSLVLFQPDELPTDLNGDGRIADDFDRAGRSLGPERLRSELLFAVPPAYVGWQRRADGTSSFSYELVNAEAIYGAAARAARGASCAEPGRQPAPRGGAAGGDRPALDSAALRSRG